jgi:hypothetical protein
MSVPLPVRGALRPRMICILTHFASGVALLRGPTPAWNDARLRLRSAASRSYPSLPTRMVLWNLGSSSVPSLAGQPGFDTGLVGASYSCMAVCGISNALRRCCSAFREVKQPMCCSRRSGHLPRHVVQHSRQRVGLMPHVAVLSQPRRLLRTPSGGDHRSAPARLGIPDVPRILLRGQAPSLRVRATTWILFRVARNRPLSGTKPTDTMTCHPWVTYHCREAGRRRWAMPTNRVVRKASTTMRRLTCCWCRRAPSRMPPRTVNRETIDFQTWMPCMEWDASARRAGYVTGRTHRHCPAVSRHRAFFPLGRRVLTCA